MNSHDINLVHMDTRDHPSRVLCYTILNAKNAGTLIHAVSDINHSFIWNFCLIGILHPSSPRVHPYYTVPANLSYVAIVWYDTVSYIFFTCVLFSKWNINVCVRVTGFSVSNEVAKWKDGLSDCFPYIWLECYSHPLTIMNWFFLIKSYIYICLLL